MEKISCVILNYNDWQTTIRAVESIIDYECIDNIIVVDNCSTDDSVSRIQKLENPKLNLIQTKSNLGYGGGNNFGFKYVKSNFTTKYILLMNPDVFISENTLHKLIEFMDSNSDYALVAPIQKLLPDSTGKSKIRYPWKLGSLKDVVLSSSIIFSKVFNVKLNYMEKDLSGFGFFDCDVIQGALYLGRTSFLTELGLYDEEIFLYNEEECLAQKVKQAGLKSAIDCSDYYIHEHSTSIKKSFNSAPKIKKLQLDSRYKYIIRYYSGLSTFQLKLIKLFFKYCIAESYVYSALKRNH